MKYCMECGSDKLMTTKTDGNDMISLKYQTCAVCGHVFELRTYKHPEESHGPFVCDISHQEQFLKEYVMNEKATISPSSSSDDSSTTLTEDEIHKEGCDCQDDCGKGDYKCPKTTVEEEKKQPEFIDAQQMAKDYETTFSAPSLSKLNSIIPGDFVKVCHNSERFWTEVKSTSGEIVVAIVKNDLIVEHPFKEEDEITFEKKHIYVIQEPE